MSSTSTIKKFSKALNAFAKAMVDEVPLPKPAKDNPISPTLLASIHKELSRSLGQCLPAAQIASIYKEMQEECSQFMAAWQHGVSYCDPSEMQLEEIQKWIVSLPKGVIFASPA